MNRIAFAALLLFAAGTARALEPPKVDSDTVAVEQMMLSLGEVARAFGPDAVVLQTALLNEAVRNGSILEATVQAPAYEQREGRKYVSFTLESGIVYNDKDVSAEDRVRRTWKEIVATALRRLTELQLKAEGLAVKVGYHHRAYDSERTLREELPAGRGEPEKMSYFLAIDDAAGVAKGTLDPDVALGRSTVLRGDDQVKLE